MSYGVDPWKSYVDMPWGVISQEEVSGWKTRAMEVLDEYMYKLTLLELPSLEAVNHIEDNSLDYIFIDGDHSYTAVLNDARAYWSKIKPGGIFAGHDWILDDVKQAVTEFREENNITTEIQFAESQVWFWYKQ
jgi:predicted O-methyltransferase YrrM